MTSNAIAVFCGDCDHDQQVVGKIASDLRCEACGSTNLGLTGVDPRPVRTAQAGLTTAAQQRLAAPKGYGTGWGKPHPDPLAGWSQDAGPTPQTYPRTPPVADSTVCPVCHGARYDLIDKAPCRECGGTGVITHATDRPDTLANDATTSVQPAGGAGWRGASRQGGFTASATSRVAGRPSVRDPYGPEYQNKAGDPRYRSRVGPSVEFDPDNAESYYPKANDRSPNTRNWAPAPAPAPVRPLTGYDPGLGYTEPNNYQMNQAACPSCGHAPTELRKDKNEDAWWTCPSCGPLANIDARPEVNPYAPEQGFRPDRGMKTGGFLSRNRKTGRLIAVLAKIHQTNNLDEREAVELARKTVRHYREGR